MFLPLKLGQQLKVHGENAIIQFIHPTSRRLQIQTDDGVSESMTLCRFHELYLEGSLVLCGDDNLRPDSIQQGMTDVPFHLFLSKEDQKQVDRKNGYLKCVTLESGRWNENTEERRLAVQEHANAIDDSKAPSESTLRRWYTRLRVYKSDIRELTPRHRKKGNRDLKIEPEVEEALNLAIDQCYLKTSKHNARFVYEHILVPMFAEGGSLSNYKPPSYKTFSNRVRKTPAYEKKLKREGYFKASMAFPNGRPVVKAAFPGERYEIDHTPADVLIVDSDGKVLGRPNLTFIIDSYSRVIVGMFTSMGPVDRRSVLKAIIHAILPKDYIHEKYPDLKNSWEFFGLFSQLVSDNGMDLLAMDVKAALFDLAIDYTQHPKKKPNRKGKVERSFGTANTELFHNLPGTTFKDYVHRGDYKSNEKACLTFEEYLEFLHR